MDVKNFKPAKVGVVGLGHVGAHVAYSLAVQGIADELVLVDKNEQKMTSECQDIRDAIAYCPHNVKVTSGSYELLGDCDVIVNATGKISLLGSGGDRNLELQYTVAQAKAFVPKIMAAGFSGVIISISNPCDVVAHTIWQMSGLPKGRVLGTGTGLDTSRLLSVLALQTGIEHQSISAYMLGEHGLAQMAAWSAVTFGGIPLATLAASGDSKFNFDREEMQKRSIMGGWVTYSGKQCTEYGIATTAARMVRCVLRDEKRIMPASMLLDGEYGEHGIFAGVHCLLGKNGVEQVMELPLTEEELAKFHTCCASIRSNVELAKKVAPAEE